MKDDNKLLLMEIGIVVLFILVLLIFGHSDRKTDCVNEYYYAPFYSEYDDSECGK